MFTVFFETKGIISENWAPDRVTVNSVTGFFSKSVLKGTHSEYILEVRKKATGLLRPTALL